MKLIFGVFIILLSLTACGGGGSSSNPAPTTPAVPAKPIPERIIFSGAGNLGIFDPSVTREPGSGRLWMSYSSIANSSYYQPALYWGVSIRLAYSDDNGMTWKDSGAVVAANIEATVGPLTEAHPAGNIVAGSQGIWQSETSSLVYDPSAPLSERWKLIWHQYLNANLVSYFVDYGWLAMKMASTPQGLETATAIKLFAGIGLQPANTNSNIPVFAPIGGAPAINLHTDFNPFG